MSVLIKGMEMPKSCAECRFKGHGGYYECSVCGEPWVFIEGTPKDNNVHYCPNCGAKMDEDEDIPMEYFENGGI